MIDDDLKKKIKIIDKYIASPSGRAKLAQAMIQPLRGPYPRCGKCGKPLSGVMSSMLHTAEECLVYYVMES